jgi:hypothetical protein
MDTGRKTQETRLNHWVGVLRERAESGQTVKLWCKENNICVKTYYYWQRKLREASCDAKEKQQASKQSQLPIPIFKKVQLIKHNDKQVPETQEGSEHVNFHPLSIELKGIRMTAGESYPPAQLAYIIRELIGTC